MLLLLAPPAADGLVPFAADEATATAQGCTRTAPRAHSCAWEATVGPTTDRAPTFLLPSLGPAVLNVSLRADGPVESHHWMIVERESGLIVANSRQHRPTDSVFNGPPGPSEFLLLLEPERAYDISIMWETLMGRNFPPATYHLGANITELAGSEPAGEEAGSAADPHLRDGLGDGEGPDSDLIAGWLSDPILDDGLILAGLQVGAIAARSEDQVDTADRISYRLSWMVLGERYEVYWSLDVVCPVAQEAARACPAALGGAWAWRGLLVRPQGSRPLPVVADAANGTLTTIVPEEWIGSPRPGDLFTELSATIWVLSAPGGAQHRGVCNQPTCRIADEATSNLRPFGLGGPPAWRALRGDVAPATVAVPWYRDPFSPDNAADVLQVAGAVAAVGTFLAGLLLVRRRRARLTRLLAEVDRAAALPDDAALPALDALEARFDAMLAHGELTEAHHATLSARAERAENRILRRRLGG